jgi:hypothetical protein
MVILDEYRQPQSLDFSKSYTPVSWEEAQAAVLNKPKYERMKTMNSGKDKNLEDKIKD